MLTQRKALVLVTLVLLCCALLGPRWTSLLSRPLQSTIDTLQWPAGWVASTIKPQAEVREENLTEVQLTKQNLELKAYNASLWSENEKLREQIKSFNAIGLVTDLEAIRPVQAKVASVNSDPVNPTMKILRGSLADIKPGDAVAFQTNLIGFVEEVGPVTGTVSLINSAKFRSQIAIMPPNQSRMENNWPVIARAEYNGKGVFRSDISEGVAKFLRVGDVVRIDDTLRDSANGFVLGDIVAIEAHPNRPLLDKRIIIEPRTPIGQQSSVTVMAERKD